MLYWILPGIACCCLEGKRTGETDTLLTIHNCLIYLSTRVYSLYYRWGDESGPDISGRDFRGWMILWWKVFHFLSPRVFAFSSPNYPIKAYLSLLLKRSVLQFYLYWYMLIQCVMILFSLNFFVVLSQRLSLLIGSRWPSFNSSISINRIAQ